MPFVKHLGDPLVSFLHVFLVLNSRLATILPRCSATRASHTLGAIKADVATPQLVLVSQLKFNDLVIDLTTCSEALNVNFPFNGGH